MRLLANIPQPTIIIILMVILTAVRRVTRVISLKSFFLFFSFTLYSAYNRMFGGSLVFRNSVSTVRHFFKRTQRLTLSRYQTEEIIPLPLGNRTHNHHFYSQTPCSCTTTRQTRYLEFQSASRCIVSCKNNLKKHKK